MNQPIFLPGSTPTPLDTMTKAHDALRSAPYEKGQSSIETEHGWLDVLKGVRTDYGWRLFGVYTAKVSA